MRRPIIKANRMADPALARALDVHTNERTAISSNLIKLLISDSRVQALWPWGSFLRGDHDDLSDLDFWLIVPPDYYMGGLP
jgi:predicted nucleotidyltransferase